MKNNKDEYRNCRCCGASYQKPTGNWYMGPVRDETGKIIPPMGFCEFCDRNNDTWYVKDLKCHSDEK